MKDGEDGIIVASNCGKIELSLAFYSQHGTLKVQSLSYQFLSLIAATNTWQIRMDVTSNESKLLEIKLCVGVLIVHVPTNQSSINSNRIRINILWLCLRLREISRQVSNWFLVEKIRVNWMSLPFNLCRMKTELINQGFLGWDYKM